MTNQGERVFRPRYGCDIQAALFDPTRRTGPHGRSRADQDRAWSSSCRAAIVRNVRVHRPPPTGRGWIVDDPLPSSLYATDVAVTVPVSSEFISRDEPDCRLEENS